MITASKAHGRDAAGFPLAVTHVGVYSRHAGGISSVIREYLSWSFPTIDVDVLPTTRQQRDLAAIPLTLAASVRIVARAVRRKRTLLVIHFSQRGSFWREGSLLILARIFGLPVVAQLHGSGFAAYWKRGTRLPRSVLRRATAIMTLTAETEQLLKSSTDLRLVPIVRIGNAVEAPPTSALMGPRQNRVVFAGEVGRRKGADVLLTGWQRVPLKVRSGWTLDLFGPIADSALMPLATDSSIELHGPVDRAQVLERLNTASIAVLPSRAEAMPMFLLEALIREVACIGTNVGAVADLLSNACGMIVPVADSQALAEALGRLMVDNEFRLSLAANGRRQTEALHSSTHVIRALADLWLECARGR